MGASSVTYGYNTDELPKLIREKYEDFNHKEKIYVSTLELRLKKVKDLLQEIDVNNADENIKEIGKNLDFLRKNLEDLLSIKDISFDGKNQAFLDLKKNNGVYKKVKKIDELYQALS
jgi:hypothetical protein